MHFVLFLLFAIIAAVCSGLDGIMKAKKSSDYEKSKRPCGAATEYKYAWDMYRRYRDKINDPNFRQEIVSELDAWPGVKSQVEDALWGNNEAFMEYVITVTARLRTAREGKCPACLTFGTSAAFPIPYGYDWALKPGQSPVTKLKYFGYEQSYYEELLRMESRSK